MATSLNFQIMFDKLCASLYYCSTKKEEKNITTHTRGCHLSGFGSHNFGVSRQHVLFGKIKIFPVVIIISLRSRVRVQFVSCESPFFRKRFKHS